MKVASSGNRGMHRVQVLRPGGSPDLPMTHSHCNVLPLQTDQILTLSTSKPAKLIPAVLHFISSHSLSWNKDPKKYESPSSPCCRKLS